MNDWPVVEDLKYFVSNDKNAYFFDCYFPIWFGTIMQILGYRRNRYHKTNGIIFFIYDHHNNFQVESYIVIWNFDLSLDNNFYDEFRL